MSRQAGRPIHPDWFRLKTAIARTILWFLGRGFSASAVHDTRIQEELNGWVDEASILLKIGPHGPSISLVKHGSRLCFLGSRETGKETIAIFFKNIDAALLVLTGRIGIARAFSEHRFTVCGDISFAMSVVRSMVLVETYLFPRFMAVNIMQRVPRKQVSSLRIYLRTLLGF